jgi:hypothetical protein
MSGTAEGIGDILTGGMVAREVESVQGHGAADPHADPHEGAGGLCLNCGTVRAGAFCQACGQSGHVHRNATALLHDILHGVFHFEGKIWTTLPMLAWHPGALTRRYVDGERAKFVSPMALFLFSVFLLFAAVNRVSMPDVAGTAEALNKAKVQVADQAGKAQVRLDHLREKRQDKAADPAKAAVLDRQIADAQKEVASLRGAAARIPTEAKDAVRVGQVKAGGQTYNFDVQQGVKEMDVETGFSAIDRQIHHVKDNPALYAYKLKMASYKFSWALIPISVPFIWLLFAWRRDVGFYDHAIFAIYSLSAMTLLVVCLIALYLVGVRSSWLWLAFLTLPWVHVYRQLKGTYRLGRFGALWRTPTLLVMTSVTSLLFFMLLLWLEAE